MFRKLIGIAFLALAFWVFAIFGAASHGHFGFRPHKGEDWLFWSAMLLFFIVGMALIFMRRKQRK